MIDKPYSFRFAREAARARPGEQITVIRNLALHPTKPMRVLPRSKLRRAWLALRGWELYGN